jgi:hypothetical protein
VQDAADKLVSGPQVSSARDVLWSDRDVVMSLGAKWHHTGTGANSWTVTGGNAVRRAGAGSGELLTIDGTLVKTGGAMTTAGVAVAVPGLWHVQSGVTQFTAGGAIGGRLLMGAGATAFARGSAPLSVQTAEGAAGSRVAADASGAVLNLLGSVLGALNATSLVGTVNINPGATFAAGATLSVEGGVANVLATAVQTPIPLISLTGGQLNVASATDAVNVLIAGGALTLSATLTVTNALNMTGGSLAGAGTLTTAQRADESVERLVRWTATALDNMSPQGVVVVTSGFALRVEGASQKTLRGWTLRLEGACEWNDGDVMFGQSALLRVTATGALIVTRCR